MHFGILTCILEAWVCGPKVLVFHNHDLEHSWLSTSLNPPVWRFLLMWIGRPVEGAFGLPRCWLYWVPLLLRVKAKPKVWYVGRRITTLSFFVYQITKYQIQFFLSGITLKIRNARCVGETTPSLQAHFATGWDIVLTLIVPNPQVRHFAAGAPHDTPGTRGRGIQK